MKSHNSRLLVGFAIGLAALWFLHRMFTPDSEHRKIERVVHQVISALADKKTADVVVHLSDDFQLSPEIDRETISGHLKRFFFQVRDLTANIEYLKHEQEDVPATATEARLLLVVRVTGTIDGQKFQAFGRAGADAVLVTLRKIDGVWRIAGGKYLDTSDPVRAFEQMMGSP